MGTVGETGIVDPGDARVAAQEFRDLAGVLDVPFDPQRDGFDSLQQQEGIEGRKHRSHGALIDAARPLDVRAGAELLDINETVIGRIGLVEGWKAAGVVRPGEATTVYDRAAERGAVAAEKIRPRMNGDVGAVVEGLQQDRRGDR